MINASEGLDLLGNGSGSAASSVEQELDINGDWRELNPRLPLQRDTVGTIGELFLAIDLLERGYEPYFPMPNRMGRYDCIAVHRTTGRILKFSAKTTCGKDEPSHFRLPLMPATYTAFIRYLGPRSETRHKKKNKA